MQRGSAASLQGLPQSRPPSREAKLQIFHAAQSLISTLSALHLSASQYQQAWARLFGREQQVPNANASRPDPHQDPNRAPQVLGPLGLHVQSVIPLSNLRSTGLLASPNTDAAMRFRIHVSPIGNLAAQIQVAKVRFGTEYRTRGADGTLLPIQPVARVQSRQESFYVDELTSTGFTLFPNRMLGANDSIDVMMAVVPGMPSVW